MDAIICDLPYGTTRNPWDSVIPLEPMWEEYRRVCKENAAIVLFSQQPFTSTLVASNPKDFRYEWIWEKEFGSGFLNANRAPLKVHENILVFYRRLPTYNPIKRTGLAPYKRTMRSSDSTNYKDYHAVETVSNGERFPIDVLRYGRDNGGFHPTQKPVDLIKYLIRTYTNEGETVLDNCMGSGTTAVAAWHTNRHFIGFETNEEYHKKSLERLKAEMAQQKLFTT